MHRKWFMRWRCSARKLIWELDFLFSCCQRIVRDVQRVLLYFGFDYAVQRFDRIGYFLLVSGSPNSLISIRAAMVSLRLESAGSGLFFMPFKDVRMRRDDLVYPNARAC